LAYLVHARDWFARCAEPLPVLIGNRHALRAGYLPTQVVEVLQRGGNP
jgi:hypothetical protein